MITIHVKHKSLFSSVHLVYLWTNLYFSSYPVIKTDFTERLDKMLEYITKLPNYAYFDATKVPSFDVNSETVQMKNHGEFCQHSAEMHQANSFDDKTSNSNTNSNNLDSFGWEWLWKLKLILKDYID